MWKVFTRKKRYSSGEDASQLARVFNTFDLTALGIGTCMGVGVYIIAGQVARETAGPAVILSFVVAAIASILSGLCYAEFGARIPRAGSAYVYSYVTVGELIAFIVGWNLILEYVVGAASVAKGISLYVDSLVNDTIKNTFKEIAPIKWSLMGDYFDFFAFGLPILLSVGLAVGLRQSSKVNNFITALNICVILVIIVAGAMNSNLKNWRLDAPDNGHGEGGFFPFGVRGMLKGAATCFYAFIGFDAIASAGEEVKNPKTALPFAIIVSQLTVFIAYFSTSTVLTLMVPYYEQDVNAPFPHAFATVGWYEIKWIVAIGAICGLFTSLFGSLLPLPRILYALANDGLIFKFFGRVNSTFSTPLIGTLFAGILTGLMAALFDLSSLVNMMSIGTLLAYTLVSTCVLILRYRDANAYEDKNTKRPKSEISFGTFFNASRQKGPTRTSERISLAYIIVYSILALIMAVLLFLLYSHLVDGRLYTIVLLSVVGGLMIMFLFLLWLQPSTLETLTFKVPLVPIIPAVSIFVNIYLMLMLDAYTWVRLGIWLLIGIPMYLICARRSYLKSKHLHTNIPSTQVLNGHLNQAFSKKPEDTPSEDSGIERSCENIQQTEEESRRKEEMVLVRSRNSITSVEDALAVLDKAIPNMDEPVYWNDPEEGYRKNSVANMSDASSIKMFKEDVVALVHREDVKTAPTTPVVEIPSAPPLSEEEEEEEGQNQLKVSEQIFKNVSSSGSLVLDDSGVADETDTDSLETEENRVPPAPSIDDFEKFKMPLIPRVNTNKEPTENQIPKDPEDLTNSTHPPPPPPPPLDGFEKYKSTPTTPKFGNSQPSTPTTSVRDYSRKSSISSKSISSRSISQEDKLENEDLSDDNVKFGGKQHQSIKDKLELMLKSKVVMQVPPTKLTKPKEYQTEDIEIDGSKTLKPVMSKIISEINRNSLANDASEEKKDAEEKLVDQTPQPQGDIRNRLDQLFKSVRVNPMDNLTVNRIRPALDQTKKIDLEDMSNGVTSNKDWEKHRANMNSALNTIKLRPRQN